MLLKLSLWSTQNNIKGYSKSFHILWFQSIKGVSISLKLFPGLWVGRGQKNCQIIIWGIPKSSYLSNAIRTNNKLRVFAHYLILGKSSKNKYYKSNYR